MQYVHVLESVVHSLFEEVCPRHHGEVRAIKPVLSPALGCLLPDRDRRRLQENRNYYRFDVVDFLDFATSGLPKPARLDEFTDNQAGFYQALDIDNPEPIITFPAFPKGLAILDVAVARSEVFVSATMRFLDSENPSMGSFLTTMTFAPMPKVEEIPGIILQTMPLEEWDRYTILPPVEDDREWRFTMSGVYTDYLLDKMQKQPGQPGAIPLERIEAARESRNTNYSTYAGLFELTRLALYLPAYFDFMYDLVLTETVPVPSGRRDRKRRGFQKGRKVSANSPIYRLVKSIRVIRPQDEKLHPTRKWSPPSYSYAVVGHWRQYVDPTVKGHDPIGNVVLGKTWVRDYVKGKDKAPQPGETSSLSVEPKVVINIKQTLAHARDVMAGHEGALSTSSAQIQPELKGRGPKGPTPDPAMKPTKEWMASERSKLTAALRFVIMRRDDFRCRLCGRSAADDPGVRLEVDHIQPVSAWGTTTEPNLWTVCRECNRGKNDRTLH